MSELSHLRKSEGYGACPDDEKEFIMLSLQLRNGEYLTIGEDIVIQVSSNSAVQLCVTAPKDKVILRGEVLERNGGRPSGLSL